MTIGAMETELVAPAFPVFVFRWIVSIVAVALALATGMSWILSAVMLGFGLATDLYRRPCRGDSP